MTVVNNEEMPIANHLDGLVTFLIFAQDVVDVCTKQLDIYAVGIIRGIGQEIFGAFYQYLIRIVACRQVSECVARFGGINGLVWDFYSSTCCRSN